MRTPILVASLALLAACGGDDSGAPTDPGGNTVTGDGNITMTVNGASWRSLKAGDRVTRMSNNFYGISGFNTPYNILLGIGNVTGPGTFNLNLSTGGNGSSAIVSTGDGAWGTAFPGGTGTITVTVLTANRIAGTFSFDAVRGSGSVTGTVQVRNGTFDVSF